MEFVWIIVIVLLVLCALLLLRSHIAAQEVVSLRNTARRQQELNRDWQERLRDQQQKLDALAETITDPVLFVSAERVITACNAAARRLTRGDMRNGDSLMESLRSHELDSVVQETIEGTHELTRDVTLNEHLFRVRVELLDKGNKLAGAVVILRDVSELQRLGRARRDFVANISHELRTPLTAIRLLVDTLRLGNGNEPEQLTRQLDQIGAQVDALTQLAQEMYDLSQIESGQVPMRMVTTPLRTIADKIITRLEPQVERAGISLLNEIGDDVRALIDPDQISRVLTNLLHNAIKFTPRGSVRVYIGDSHPPRTSMADASGGIDGIAPDDYWTVVVRDSGLGISRTDLPRIFERFYKVSQARGQGGTGLGLAIAKHIVEAHGGRIWVESVQGQGATFYFTIPRGE